jgi:hypothetical protein
MKKSGRSKKGSEDDRSKRETIAKIDIERNNIFLSTSVGYFFIVLYASLTEQVERSFGIILILTSIMIAWYFVDERKEIRRRIEAW